MRDDGTAAEVEAPRRHIIKRPRLTRLLDQADARILMLVAPAGYGKTTLAREWIEDGGRRAFWITISPAVADVAALGIRLRDALSVAFPDLGSHLEERLRSASRTSGEVQLIADYLADGIPEWPAEAWLVIDDYHHLADSPDADGLVAQLIEAANARALIASRQRPRWATARRLMYGEIQELGASALAMDYDEALEVLQRRGQREARGLLALADGWPAIIGLAANATTDDVPGERMSDSLYDFFADELYRGTTDRIRAGLMTLAYAPVIDSDIAVALLGKSAHEVLSESVRVGFLQERAGEYVMHSLIRDFLHRRRRPGDVDEEQILGILSALAVRQRSFEILFDLVQSFPESRTLRNAADAVLTELLQSNRVEAVDRWLKYALSVGLDTPAVELAHAEVAFREGRYEQAELLARRSAHRFADNPHLASSAWFRAGQSAYHANRSDLALQHHEQAIALSATEDDRLRGLWGLLTTTLELERDASALIGELEKSAPTNLVSQVRLANARLSNAYRRGGGLRPALDEGYAALPLLERIDDPMVKSAFLNTYAFALLVAGEYERALSVVSDELAVVEEWRLNFAVPHALSLRAAIHIGRQAYADARHDLHSARHAASRSDDEFSLANIALNEIRLLLCQGRSSEAVNQASATHFSDRMPTLNAELLAVRALALAAIGRSSEAQEAIRTVEMLTEAIETRGYAAWARVLAEPSQDSTTTRALAAEAFEIAVESGCIHPLVCAYRASPILLTSLAYAPSAKAALPGIISRARDDALARAAGISLPSRATGALTRRETEVLTLLGQGLSNREIAKRLFISEVTAKAHVRRIFEKLGVHSRTQAALMAASYLADGGERS